ncbi:chromosome segregation protein SMC [Streptococcus chenjunshii]|uniref:Chromosome partition protein Smc n=1 Tax=Streptococcus chenjunshii TaxID=2173853 RepID=A0A372KLG6_9STRE|nr:chromosome segregation protein SMC [Streptococcus chenjunshii]AXQ79075.1 chromosome segregation protein SMC [Streptococcus chenjunshii]RFU51271.1 chromosome segregation protein SMC [Streptococcus chenjunshii]RFU53113.1 chromosome segregation protein SMC [Streptococcus chenjunshii]
MFLKEIEMQGFKSFADKTKITFDKGVTAVVGPNGSGKSNITESLRWALGESSAKSLRGGKMPDVIFAGTENRKALNYAQVTVVLDNSDGFIKEAKDEIRVERHIYRSGDSDYLIDGRKVRLRDVHDLFMDTGLGRDSFSIISQGRVEAIFNSKPEERRAIFEEAAGVLKYKTRKKETQSKLGQTQDNLDRLADIIYELETQIKPLEKQAQTAKEFLALEEQRKQLQLDILVEDIDNDKLKLDRSTQELEEVKKQLSVYYKERQNLETKNQTLKKRRHTISEEMNQKQTGLVELTRLLADTERRIDLINLESSQKQERQQEADQRLTALNAEAASLKSDLADKEEYLRQLSEKLTRLSAEIKELEAESERISSDPDQMLEKLRENFVQIMQKEADASNNLTAVLTEIDNQKQLSESQAEEIEQLQQELETAGQETENASANVAKAKNVLKELLDQYQNLSQQLQTDEKKYEDERAKMFALADSLRAKEARRDSLSAIIKNHSNFYAGVRAVLQNSAKLGGIIGAVSEHLSFPHDYQTAFEIVLGASSQHIIVADEAAAKRAIAYLKKNRQGRATFLPLTTIKPRELSSQNLSKLASCQGFLGAASELAVFSPDLEKIFKNLLGLTALFDTVDNANRAARLLRYQVRLVTLDGTEIRPGGSFSGGSSRQNSTSFVKPELEHLTAEIDAEKINQHKQEQLVGRLKQVLTEKKASLEEIKTEGETARLAEQRAELEYNRLSERLGDLQEVYQGLKAGSADQAKEHLNEEKEKFEQLLAGLAEKKEALTAEIEQIKENKGVLSQKADNLAQELAKARLDERELLSEKKFEEANKNRLKNNLTETETNIKELEVLLRDRLSLSADQELPKLQTQLSEAKARKEEDEKRLVQLRIELEDCEAQLEELSLAVQEANQQNEVFIRKQAQYEAEIEQISERLRISARSLAEDYQMTLDEAKTRAQTIEDSKLARQKLQTLRRQIKALGPINVDAIEQYDEVNERLLFLNSQKDDLVRAKNLLLETIHEMDDEVKNRFKVTFAAIRDSFKETFKQMFGGGSSDLFLTEGDLLTAGIEISVQPPGKKIQSLNLMSGGEKALSALALLFAIIRVRTIPFVILDEVEAALDEANVKRFGDYLNRFDKSSQFIVVTHRKGTMAAADSIYGVTMQESGVSKIVSVKLKEAEELLN